MNLKPVCLLLSLCYAGSAPALGLGELNLRSSLDQPLHATVTLLGTSADTTADCFSLDASEHGIAPPPRAQLSLQRTGDQTLLHIRTLQPVNEPITQFVLVSDCETRLQRDYTVFLDPPALVTPAPISPAAPDAATPGTAPVTAPTPRTSQSNPPRRVKHAAQASSTPVARSRQLAAPGAQRAPTDATPRLVLSGRRGPRDTPGALALRLDTNLPDLARPHPGSLSATELSDENTALAHKLAHLEAQLLALQQRNAKLESRRAAVPATLTPPPERPAQWPLYLLSIGLITAGIALVAWLLRRSRPAHSVFMDDAPWTQPDATMRTPSDMAAEAQAKPEPERMEEIASRPRAEGAELKEGILDQAEVFMAFGHGDFAIHLLQEHLRDAPTKSPVPWLLLLDLLHRGGDTEGYTAASTECRRYFNVNLTGHPISQNDEPGKGLDAYPHLLEQMVRLWNTPDIEAFFHDLIYDDRGGTRMGFEPGAYRDILLLRTIAREALPLAAEPAAAAMAKPKGRVATQPKPELQWQPGIALSTLQGGTEIKDGILDQAEVYIAHDHSDLAIHLLQEHLRDAPTKSPVPWLLLLDLLHRGGDTEGYTAASTECRRYFNVNLTGHPVSQDGEPNQGLEAYPHLLDRLVEEWGTPHIDDFFEELIYDQRGRTRIGFEPDAYRDILLLRAIARDALPLAAEPAAAIKYVGIHAVNLA